MSMFCVIEVQTAFFHVIMLYFAKLFVILHRRKCLTLIKIAKFQRGVTDGSPLSYNKGRTTLQLSALEC